MELINYYLINLIHYYYSAISPPIVFRYLNSKSQIPGGPINMVVLAFQELILHKNIYFASETAN